MLLQNFKLNMLARGIGEVRNSKTFDRALFPLERRLEAVFCIRETFKDRETSHEQIRLKKGKSQRRVWKCQRGRERQRTSLDQRVFTTCKERQEANTTRYTHTFRKLKKHNKWTEDDTGKAEK